MTDKADSVMNNGKNIAYVRVSTIDQNEARQMEALKKHNIDKWFIEKVSAKDTNRPELKKMLDYVREGDVVFIHDLSRLARSTKDLLEVVEQLQSKGVELVSNKENIDTNTPTGKLMLTMIGAIAEFERANLLERQREGIAIAKAEHRYKGRKPVNIDDEVFKREYERYQNREINKGELASALDVSRPTLDKVIKQNRFLYMQEIQKHSKDFLGTLDDEECMTKIGLAPSTYFKYKKALEEERSK